MNKETQAIRNDVGQLAEDARALLTIHRYVAAVAKLAGVAPVHPHQLRHTLATQAINRGMSLEAIAALLGHRSMKMTLTYARISDRTVADEYFRVTAAVEAHQRGHTLPAAADTAITQLAADHRRLLGNGHCNRPAALDCIHESICERCGFFETSSEFVPVLIRQRDHATTHDQPCGSRLLPESICSGPCRSSVPAIRPSSTKPIWAMVE